MNNELAGAEKDYRYRGSRFSGECPGAKAQGIWLPGGLCSPQSDYNLVENEAVKRLYRDSRPEIVIHLAA